MQITIIKWDAKMLRLGIRNVAAGCALAILALAPCADAEPVNFEGLRFEIPALLIATDAGPRPPTPFLRFKHGERSDPHSEFVEVMSGSENSLPGGIEGFAASALTPASLFCGRHEVLRNTTRRDGEARIVDIGYVCFEHSRQRQYSRQVVRTVGVVHGGKFTMFMFARMWLRTPHPDDQLTSEEWMAPTDALAASIALAD